MYDEARMCLLIARAWGYVGAEKPAEALAILDSILAILWKLTQQG